MNRCIAIPEVPKLQDSKTVSVDAESARTLNLVPFPHSLAPYRTLSNALRGEHPSIDLRDNASKPTSGGPGAGFCNYGTLARARILELIAMRRRDVILFVGGAVAALPLAARAQQPAKLKRIGFLRVRPPPPAWIGALRQGLREHGLIEGQNIEIEFGLAESVAELPSVAAE